MTVELCALKGMPEIHPGDNLAQIIIDSLTRSKKRLKENDILVIAHKVVSKSEGSIVDIAAIKPSAQALEIAEKVKKDPRKVEIIIRESAEILRVREPLGAGEGVIIARHKKGYICANAAIDESNTGQQNTCILLPSDPDQSARQLQANIDKQLGIKPGIIISDTFGRPWRLGQVNVAIGLASVPALTDLTASTDAWGRPLNVTKPAIADEIAAASGLVMAKDAMTPVIHVSGVDWCREDRCSINDLMRTPAEDLFQ